MFSNSVGHEVRIKPDFVLAEVKSLNDHSYATHDDSISTELKHINETCQKILKNQSLIMKDIALIKQESNIVESCDYEIGKFKKNSKTVEQKLAKPIVNKMRVKLPCSSVEEVEDLEEKIKNNKQFENFMVQYFERIQEYELPKFLKSAFQSVMTEEVAKCFTWYGLNNNRCIKDFKFISILLEIANRKFTQAPKEITIHFMKKYFVTCKDKSRKKQLNLYKTQQITKTKSSLQS